MTMPVAPPWGFGRGGKPVMVPPQSADLPQAAIVLQLPLPEISPIPDATEFNPEGFVNQAGAAANVLIPGCAVEVPVNNKFVINSLSLYIDDMLTTTDVTWSLFVNGAGVKGWTNLRLFPRLAPFVGNSFSPLIRGRGAATITAQFTQADGGTYKIGLSYSGWYWPEASDQRWRSGDASW